MADVVLWVSRRKQKGTGGMEIGLDMLIGVCRQAVDRFARNLDEGSAETLCRKTRSLSVRVLLAATVYEGILTDQRSSAVEEIFEAALQAHAEFDKKADPNISEEGREQVAGYQERLERRYAELKDVLVHHELAIEGA